MTRGSADNRDPDAMALKLYETLKEVADTDFPQHIPDPDALPEIDRKLCNFQLNDKGNAQRLIARFGEDLLYIPQAGWYGWTGQYWSHDEGPYIAQKSAHKTSDAMRDEALAKLAGGNFPTETPTEFRDRIKKFYGYYAQSGNSQRLISMVREAEPYLKSSGDELDTHELVINVENGTVHLKAENDGSEDFDGVVLKEHERALKLTKMMPVKYDPHAQAPHFQKFLNDIQPDPEIQVFLQRFFGYCLTGSIREQIIVMMYGGGANGKSTIMNMINRIMGDYALNLPFASLLHDDRKRGSEASPDLARLPGARFVTAAEPDVGSKFSESILKQLTGGEKMAVRHLHRDFFEFMPQFKLCLAFNNKPQIRGQDDGIWRRVCLVPFDQQFVSAEKLAQHPNAKLRVDGLEDKLWEEASGILNWLIDGYRMWQESGLKIPDKIRAATTEYREESNPVGGFVESMIVRGGTHVRASDVYQTYVLWCKENAQRPWSQKAFGTKMNDMQFKKSKIGGLVFYDDIDLSPEGRALLEGSRKFGGNNDD